MHVNDQRDLGFRIGAMHEEYMVSEDGAFNSSLKIQQLFYYQLKALYTSSEQTPVYFM